MFYQVRIGSYHSVRRFTPKYCGGQPWTATRY